MNNERIETDTTIYNPVLELGVGFNNELQKVMVLGDKIKILGGGKIQTLTERIQNAHGLEAGENIIEAFNSNPEKVARIDDIVKYINELDPTSPDSVIETKRALNEIKRLINGKDATLPYLEEEAAPNLLSI